MGEGPHAGRPRDLGRGQVPSQTRVRRRDGRYPSRARGVRRRRIRASRERAQSGRG